MDKTRLIAALVIALAAARRRFDLSYGDSHNARHRSELSAAQLCSVMPNATDVARQVIETKASRIERLRS
jgi:predicted outer membrane protein